MGAITRGIANNILGSGAIDGTDALSGTIPATNIANATLDNLTTFPPSVDAGIPQVAGDPPAPSDGDVWYNTNTYKLKVRGLSAALGSWATGTSVNSARRGLGSNGTYTSALIYGGYEGDYTGKTESWNGSAWTEVADLTNIRNGNTGAGADNTSALSIGGYSSTLLYNGRTETWDGSSWTEVNDLNTARSASGGTGTSTAAITVGGNIPPNSSVTNNESWNGTSWSEVGDLNTAREGASGSNAGTQTAALFAGGHQGNPAPNFNSALVEQWNGTNWVEVNDLNTAGEHRNNTGTSTTALAYGGNGPPSLAQTELWNGTSWTEVGDLSTARTQLGKSGNSNNSLAISGYTGEANTAATEEWNAAASNLNVDLA